MSVKDDKFVPKSTTVAKGEGDLDLAWTERSHRHVHEGPERREQAWRRRAKQGRFTRSFTKRGTYRYICEIHAPDMKGSVTPVPDRVAGAREGIPVHDCGVGRCGGNGATRLGCLGLGADTTTASYGKRIAIEDNFFDPRSVTIRRGEIVRWRWYGEKLPQRHLREGAQPSKPARRRQQTMADSSDRSERRASTSTFAPTTTGWSAPSTYASAAGPAKYGRRASATDARAGFAVLRTSGTSRSWCAAVKKFR